MSWAGETPSSWVFQATISSPPRTIPLREPPRGMSDQEQRSLTQANTANSKKLARKLEDCEQFPVVKKILSSSFDWRRTPCLCSYAAIGTPVSTSSTCPQPKRLLARIGFFIGAIGTFLGGFLGDKPLIRLATRDGIFGYQQYH